MIRHHFAGQDDARGVYAKELHISAGTLLTSHRHAYDHLSILASGFASLTLGDDVPHVLHGPVALTIPKGAEHTLRAITDVVWFCIHPTEETDTLKIDEAILSQESV
jgi:quercetin dioxygenase-like cupin family protein